MRKRIIYLGCCILLLLLIIAPFAESIYYTLPSADDFVWIRGKAVGTHNMFLSAINIANNFWLTWQGQWPVTFWGFLVNPLNFGEEYSRQLLGTEMVLWFVLFLVAVGGVVHSFVKWQIRIKNIILELFIFDIIIFAFLNIMIYTESFYWFTGATYTWALTLHLWSLALIIRYMNNKASASNTIVLSIVGFLACMSAYIGAVLQGMVMLLYLWEKRKTDCYGKRRVIPLLFMIFGGCLSALAPGNFKRAELVTTERLGLGEILNSTGYYYLKSVQMLITNPIFWISLFAIILVGIVTNKKRCDVCDELIRLCKFIFISVISVYFVIFPIQLGYNGAMVPERAYCFINMYNLLTIFLCAYVFGKVFASIWTNKVLMKLCKYGLVVGIVGTMLFTISSNIFYQLPYYIITTRMDSIKWVNAAWTDILSQIGESEEEHVVIHSPAFDTYILKEPGITENKDDWANKIVADFYGKESVQVIMK